MILHRGKGGLPRLLPRSRRPLSVRRGGRPAITKNTGRHNTSRFRVSHLARVGSSQAAYKIAIARLKPGLGDILMITPSLLGLREKFPSAHVTLIVQSHYTTDIAPGSKHGVIYEAVKHLPWVDVVLDANYETYNPGRFDFFVDISGQAGEIQEERPTTKPRERIDIFSHYLGVDPSIKRPYLHLPEDTLATGRELIQRQVGQFNRPLILFFQNSNTGFRDPSLQSLQTAVSLLKRRNDIYVGVVSEAYRDPWGIPGVLEWRGLSVKEFFGLVGVSELIVSPDTGPLHMAGALNKKLVGLWGGTHPGSRTSYYRNVTNLWHPEKCSRAPCWYSNSGCANRVCITSISGKEIANAVEERLACPLDKGILWRGEVGLAIEAQEWNIQLFNMLKGLPSTVKNVDIKSLDILSSLPAPQEDVWGKVLEAYNVLSPNDWQPKGDLTCSVKPNLRMKTGWLNRELASFNLEAAGQQSLAPKIDGAHLRASSSIIGTGGKLS
jgi:hypothetical protein